MGDRAPRPRATPRGHLDLTRPIRPEAARSATSEPVRSTWDEDRVVLYHLGLGAGNRPEDPREVRYVHERQLVVLPTFAVVPASDASSAVLEDPGLGLDLTRVIHATQELVLHRRTVPPKGAALSRARVEDVYDGGRAAVVVVRVDTDLDGGEPLSTVRFGLHVPGAGGFGGQRGPSARDVGPPGPPERRFDTPTLPQQAALYRLSSDRTPVHVDPVAARAAGLDRPSLQGLCTWGMVGKGLVDEILDGDVGRVAAYRARFSGVVFPGETLRTAVWRGAGELVVRTTVVERDAPALSQVRMTLRR